MLTTLKCVLPHLTHRQRGVGRAVGNFFPLGKKLCKNRLILYTRILRGFSKRTIVDGGNPCFKRALNNIPKRFENAIASWEGLLGTKRLRTRSLIKENYTITFSHTTE